MRSYGFRVIAYLSLDNYDSAVEHSLHRLKATASESKRITKSLGNLMQEGGGIEPHRAITRLTAYKAVSSPNGLRLPEKSRALSRPAPALLAFRFGCAGREAEGFQPVISRVDHATVF